MTATLFLRGAGLVVLGLTTLVSPAAQSQAPSKIQPKLEPIAETKLLMEGLAHVNFRGIERILQQKPADVQAWTFARGQALLIAETANLLMLRPPRASGQAVWFERSMDLRTTAQQMAKTAVTQDYDKSKAMLVTLAASCNRCHQAFRVPAEITAFDDKGKALP